MPELPEVARTAIGLNKILEGSTLNEIKILSGRYSRHGNPPGMDDFILDFPVVINRVDFYGKLIIFEFQSSNRTWWCWNTLGMSGGWRTFHTKHGHVEFVTDRGSVWFTDVRNFGTLRFTDNQKATDAKRNSIGPNHLRDEISNELFEARLMKTPESNICQALMNQTLIGGIGNYIKAEILYRARISPHRKVKDLSKTEFEALNTQCKTVVESSFGLGGSSFKNYQGIEGESGEFPFFFHVYGRQTCENGYSVKSEVTLDGRMTHWVPELQM